VGCSGRWGGGSCGNAFDPITIISDEDHGAITYAETRYSAFSGKADNTQQRWQQQQQRHHAVQLTTPHSSNPNAIPSQHVRRHQHHPNPIIITSDDSNRQSGLVRGAFRSWSYYEIDGVDNMGLATKIESAQ
jgi:hypothetical protein